MNKPCDTYLPALVDAAEGHPSPELEAHLSGCAGCRAELAELGVTLEALAPAPAPEPGPWLAPKIRAHHESRAPRVRLLRWALPALVPAALIFTVLWTGPAEQQARASLPSLEALAAELAAMDAEALETVLVETESYATLGTSEDSLDDLALALAETDEEVLDTVLGETSFGYLDYETSDEGSEALEGLDTQLDLLLEAIPG